MRRLLAFLVLLTAPATALAQGTFQTSGRISTGLQQVENNTNSSKLTEYRDLRDDRFPFALRFEALSPQGLFLGLAGANLTRRDQSLNLAAGGLGVWRFDLLWDELPHNSSNKAQSPYTARSPGLLEVSQPIAMPLKKLATGSADKARVLASDTVIAAWAQAFTRPIDLDNRTKTGSLAFRYTGIEALDLSIRYSRRAKTGSHLGYGPIGDRPPRTLNIQLAEPVDYLTSDLVAAAEYDGGRYQLRAEYLFSDFANDVDELVWQNVYATPAAGSEFDTWDRQVAAYGRRPLPPDNRYQNATLTAGAHLPLDSRLVASVSYGRMEQNEPLLPYAWHASALANSTLPRTSADARMNTFSYSAEYWLAPIQRLDLRAFFRRFDLDNETPASQWQYVTQDVSNLNGTVAYVNKRVSEPIAWDRQNTGVDATWRFGVWRSSLGFGFEREEIGREHREAEQTSESVLRASWRARPLSWLSLRAKYLRGDRDGGTYDWRVPRESYWYAATEATDNNNPQFTFENHPDMRRYDISDRRRDRVDLTAALTTGGPFSLATTFTYWRDDFDADVEPEQPLLGRPVADSLATTPGDQLGLLRSEVRQFGLDLAYAPAGRISLNASLGYDAGESSQQGIEFNENNKQNPSAVATATLGPWNRASSQWTADFDGHTRYAGVGGTYDIVPGRVSLSANYTLSLSDIEIDYAGYGVTNFDGTPFPPDHEFSFQTPPPVRHDSHVADLSLDFPLVRNIGARLGYSYESYKIRDWQQETHTLQFESVGTELLLRDTSRSHQWGNRLFNVGAVLAPGYTAHVVYASLSYHFGAKPIVATLLQ